MSINKRRMDPVFLLSPGRSGSTLLQRHLNCSKDLILWGEHGGFLRGLRNTYQNWCENTNIQYLLNIGSAHSSRLLSSDIAVGVDIEWTNNFSRDTLRENMANMIAELFSYGVPDQVRWGFKEIRYDNRDVLFLKELFPAAQFVFIVRNPLDTLASAIVAFAKGQDLWESQELSEENILKIKEQVRLWSIRILNIATGISICVNNHDGYLVKYEDLKDSPIKIMKIISQYLNISTPLIKNTKLIAADVRQGTDTSKVRRRLVTEFISESHTQELIQLYKTMGYD